MTTLLALLSILMLTILTFLYYRCYQQKQIIKKSKFLTSKGGISSVEEVMLGGLKQYILIQAEDSSKPVLLVLHGGPGMPVPGVGCRGVDWVFNITTSELIKHFIVVFWDQRGSGKSYAREIHTSSMNFEQFVSDANELTDWLRIRFGQEKIYLSGASWGSMIGLQLAEQHPEKIHAYFGISQITNWSKSDNLAYDWLLKKANEAQDKKAQKELIKIGRPPYSKELAHWNVLRKWLFKLGGYIYQNDQIHHPGMASLFIILLKSPDYRFLDIWNNFYKGMKLSYSPQMLADFHNFDALSQLKKLEVPCYFFHGKHDMSISGQLLDEYVKQLEAPKGKKLHWLEHSAHIYCPSDARMVEKLIINYAQY